MERNQIKPIWVLAAMVVVGWPTPALANTGTPLMWVEAIHLLVGNAIIGWLEGWLISRMLGGSRLRAALLMIPANYVSMFAGMAGVDWLNEQVATGMLEPEPLYRVGRVLGLSLVAAFAGSVLIEWPFCYFVAKRGSRKASHSALACLAAQCASYAALVPLYLGVGSISVISGVELDRSLAFVNQPEAWVYFISTHDGDVYRIRANGTAREKVFEAGIVDADARLFVRRAGDGGPWDLCIRGHPEEDSESLLIAGFASRAALSWRRLLSPANQEAGTWFNSGEASDLRPEGDRPWKARTGFWAGQGLLCENPDRGIRLRIALETPFVQWHARNAMVLPGDQVIYQLDDQLVVLDLETRRMGLLTKGRGPVVILEEPRSVATK